MKLLAFIAILAAVSCTAAEPPDSPLRVPPRDAPPRALGALIFENPEGVPRDYRLAYEQNLERNGAIVAFVFSDPKAWRISKTEASAALELFGRSNYKPKDRSPLNIALIRDKVFGDFVLDVDLQSTVKPYGHQDMCLFFGFENTNRFYYVHLAVAADPNAHNIFLVNDAPRRNIAQETTAGITWGENTWHRVRVARSLSDGSIKVYFDDFTRPIMIAEDRTLGRGYIGFGSFDDMGRIDNIRIYAPSVETKPAPFFRPASEDKH